MQAVYSQRDAIFRGAEFQTQYRRGPALARAVGRRRPATTSCARPSPTAATCRASRRSVSAAASIIATTTGSRASACCTPSRRTTSRNSRPTTADYNLLKAEISYSSKLPGDPTGLTQLKLGIIGDNLLNEDVRFAQSFKKDEVLQPGRTVKVFANLKF